MKSPWATPNDPRITQKIDLVQLWREEQEAHLAQVAEDAKRKREPKRYLATCPVCGYTAERAKREAAEHILAQHRAYSEGCSE